MDPLQRQQRRRVSGNYLWLLWWRVPGDLNWDIRMLEVWNSTDSLNTSGQRESREAVKLGVKGVRRRVLGHRD